MTEQAMDEARQLSEWLSGTDIALLELSGPGKRIRLRRDGAGYSACAAPQQAAASETPASATTLVRAGSVGIVLHAHPLREETLVRPGQPVAAGQVLVLLQIGAVLLAVPAPRAGVVAGVIAANESLVGYGDPLVELE
jgi:acetyl-CoA carboxylase biotin carboxyl carrier protein